MKQTIKFIGKVIVAAIVAMFMALVIAWQGAGFNAVAIVFFCTALALAGLMGAFDVPAKKGKYDSIRHKMGSKSYGQAAIFLGTACVFVGTPKECEERADDLLHYGQQVRVEDNIEGMEFNIL